MEAEEIINAQILCSELRTVQLVYTKMINVQFTILGTNVDWHHMTENLYSWISSCRAGSLAHTRTISMY